MEQQTPQQPKVIIVDDDRETREMLTLTLELEGFEVAQAANGLRLISILHVDQEEQHLYFSLFLLCCLSPSEEASP